MAILRLFRRHEAKFTWLLAFAALIGYPAFLTRLNPPPDEQRTEIVRGVVVKAGREHPHIRLQFSDGGTENFQFPGDLVGVLVGKHPRFYEATDYELNELIGCRTELKVDRIRYLPIPSSRRIWSLQCDRITLPYSRMVSYYESQSGFTAGHWFIAISAAFLLLACATRDAKSALTAPAIAEGRRARFSLPKSNRPGNGDDH